MKKLMFYWDYIVTYLLTSTRNKPYYHRYMWQEYGTWYCTEEQWKQYWDSLTYLDN